MGKSFLNKKKRLDLNNLFAGKKSRQRRTKSDIDVRELRKDSENEIMISNDYNY